MTLQRTIIALTLAAGFAVLGTPAFAQEHEHEAPAPPRVKWSFGGPLGKYDQAQLQRGFKVYREVCSVCHSIQMLAFRNLADPGGPGFSEAQAEAVAGEYKIDDLDDKGQPIQRAARLADYFPSSFPNALAAVAVHGAVPPDMSTLVKARGYQRGFPWFVFDMFTQYQEHGADYVEALLKGYVDAPKDFALPSGSYYNKYFPGHIIAMRPPLQAGQVTYDDGSPPTLEQYSQDVTAFLEWVAEPHLVVRKRIGAQVMFFLIVFAGLMYFTKKKVWSAVH